MHYLNKKYGNIWSLYITGFGQVTTSLNAEDVEYVLNSNFENFVRIDKNSKKQSWRMSAFFGRGIFAANGKDWHQQRHAARDYFTIKALDSYLPIFLEKSKVVSTKLEEARVAGTSLDIQDIFFRYTLDSFGLMGFGFDFDSLTQMPAFPAIFDYLQLRVEETLRNPVHRKAADPAFSAKLKELDQTIYSMIETRKKENFEDKTDLLSRFMCLKDQEGKPYDDEWLRDILFNFLIAGRGDGIFLNFFFFSKNKI
jgi:cytochrome P450